MASRALYVEHVSIMTVVRFDGMNSKDATPSNPGLRRGTSVGRNNNRQNGPSYHPQTVDARMVVSFGVTPFVQISDTHRACLVDYFARARGASLATRPAGNHVEQTIFCS